MIDKTPIPGLDLNNTEAKAQINNFWNYLDDLATNNPEEYKKFIKAQMQKGISMAESIKKRITKRTKAIKRQKRSHKNPRYSKRILQRRKSKIKSRAKWAF